ncbi:hypothetical protein CLPUN_51180 [Clostridium puniceum]|uniref:Uncharacterized protein n=1 Tax=Clostridium puniceum TaxID=29367 RepID=A0A1S8T029_9CLOT|nr:hypothetical protein [Clostridium puniceum]OOM71126.1 hypothetical protein CLPUN_51180 [Clostridium puniceum]
MIISGDASSIETKTMRWSGAGGGISPGLSKRCRARVNMCLYEEYDSTYQKIIAATYRTLYKGVEIKSYNIYEK